MCPDFYSKGVKTPGLVSEDVRTLIMEGSITATMTIY